MIKSKKVRVIGFGTFDGIHNGHVNFLQQLKELGHEVYVTVARDQNVQKIKGHSPRFNEKERFEALQKTGLVDRVIMGNQHNFYQCIIDHQPDVIALGYDQKADIDQLKKMFPNIKVVRLKAFDPERYKSSLLTGY